MTNKEKTLLVSLLKEESDYLLRMRDSIERRGANPNGINSQLMYVKGIFQACKIVGINTDDFSWIYNL